MLESFRTRVRSNLYLGLLNSVLRETGVQLSLETISLTLCYPSRNQGVFPNPKFQSNLKLRNETVNRYTKITPETQGKGVDISSVESQEVSVS